MKFSRGLKPPTPGRSDHRLGVHLHLAIAAALAAGPTGAATLEPCPRMDQGQTSTCHAHSAAAAIWAAKKAAGAPLPFVPSPVEIASCTYADVRAAKFPSGGLPVLTDDGAELQDDATALAKWGIAAIKAPTADGRFSDVPNDVDGVPFPEPDQGQLQVSGANLIAGEYAIAVDENAPRTVAACLDAGVPVWLGTLVDAAFEELGPNDIAQPADASDPTAGGHALYISAYRTNSLGLFEYRVENSWGVIWADEGAVWASEAWLVACWALWPMAVAS